MIEFSKPYFDGKYLNEEAKATFEKLIRLDKKDPNNIKAAIKNGREDDFWGRNFLSPVKLRKKNDDGVFYIDVFLNLNRKNGHPQAKPQYNNFESTNERVL